MTEAIQKKIENGREYRSMLMEANTDNDEYIVEDCERDIPQFVCNI